MESNNVLIFPKKNENVKSFLDQKEVEQNVQNIRLYHIQETMSEILPHIFAKLDLAGFDVSEESEFMKDGAFIVESLRSFMCKYYGIYHPFQEIANSVFIPVEKEVNTLKISESLNLKFNISETN